ncbi:MAG: transporter [Bacteroidota bacterium]
MKAALLFWLLFLGAFGISKAQYTETINTNRPGLSYGAFGVGNNVWQFETGLSYGNNNHSLRQADANIIGFDYAVRYGLFMERLEVIWDGTFLSQNETIPVGGGEQSYRASNFERNTIGAKYLIYDPWVKRELEGPNLLSWKRDNTIQWHHLIPAVSVYGGVNLHFGNSVFMPPEDPHISSRLGIITQHNYRRLSFVSNFIVDRISTSYTNFTGIFTLTQTVDRDKALFIEFQTYIGDFYSDEVVRVGGAYLYNQNLQFDAFGLVNFKDTPQRWQLGIGVSYRLDTHKEEEFLFESEEDRKKFEQSQDRKNRKDDKKFEIPYD